MTQKEKVMRYLAQNLNKWIPSYELVKATTEAGYTGLQADRRAFELAKVGYYDSPTRRYKVSRRKNGRYTEFRASVDEFDLPTTLKAMEDWFISLPLRHR